MPLAKHPSVYLLILNSTEESAEDGTLGYQIRICRFALVDMLTDNLPAPLLTILSTSSVLRRDAVTLHLLI